MSDWLAESALALQRARQRPQSREEWEQGVLSFPRAKRHASDTEPEEERVAPEVALVERHKIEAHPEEDDDDADAECTQARSSRGPVVRQLKECWVDEATDPGCVFYHASIGSQSVCAEFRCKGEITSQQVTVCIRARPGYATRYQGAYHLYCLWSTFWYKKFANKRILNAADITNFDELPVGAQQELHSHIFGDTLTIVEDRDGQLDVRGDTPRLRGVLLSLGATWYGREQKWIAPLSSRACRVFQLEAPPAPPVKRGVFRTMVAAGLENSNLPLALVTLVADYCHMDLADYSVPSKLTTKRVPGSLACASVSNLASSALLASSTSASSASSESLKSPKTSSARKSSSRKPKRKPKPSSPKSKRRPRTRAVQPSSAPNSVGNEWETIDAVVVAELAVPVEPSLADEQTFAPDTEHNINTKHLPTLKKQNKQKKQKRSQGKSGVVALLSTVEAVKTRKRKVVSYKEHDVEPVESDSDHASRHHCQRQETANTANATNAAISAEAENSASVGTDKDRAPDSAPVLASMAIEDEDKVGGGSSDVLTQNTNIRGLDDEHQLALRAKRPKTNSKSKKKARTAEEVKRAHAESNSVVHVRAGTGGELYLWGDTFALKDYFKFHGARWDGRVQRWVFGPGQVAEGLTALNLDAAPVEELRLKGVDIVAGITARKRRSIQAFAKNPSGYRRRKNAERRRDAKQLARDAGVSSVDQNDGGDGSAPYRKRWWLWKRRGAAPSGTNKAPKLS